MKNYFFGLLLLISSSTFGQTSKLNGEHFPVFNGCENENKALVEACFYKQVQDFIFTHFKVPEKLSNQNFNGFVTAVFEVNETGKFQLLYVDASEKELVAASQNVFNLFPVIAPPTFNGVPTYGKYTVKINIPLQSAAQIATEKEAQRIADATNFAKTRNKALTEFDSVVYKKFNKPQFKSNLNIPFSHSFYARFDAALNQIGSNNHTGSKPFLYSEVLKYYDLKAETEKLVKGSNGWWNRKIWDENSVQIQGDGYWFTLNPIFDLQTGKTVAGKTQSTFVNTRGLQFQGGLGEQLNFTTTIYESQGRFADYYNRYAESIQPDGGNPAIIPGIGIAKEFKTNAYDFPSAEANLTFTANKFINLQLGFGRNFIGDGYRSLLEGDAASPYPYLKMNTTFWKIKYTNTYMWLKDVRTDVTADKTYATKYMANHYLSYNISKKMNIGFFESVIWSNANGRGFDMNFVNPIIFYRTVEFTSSARNGNALLGFTSKYKWNNQVTFYGQFLLDEFSISAVKAGNNSWKNKWGYQLGVKYFNALNVPNLLLQVEYNHVRPYTYSHLDALTNYGHNNQSMGHPWGGNFKELVFITRYNKGRYFADFKFTYGLRGLDFNTTTDPANYGSNIYLSYDSNRPFDTGVKVGQGNTTTLYMTDLQLGYLVNPNTNMKLFGSIIYRSSNPFEENAVYLKESTTWFSLGLRCDVFNWYFDY